MQWFVENVYPFILKSLPDANLIITGNHVNLTLSRTENITFAGYVDDIKSLIASCDISIAPLWTGGGTRLKILEAMAFGIPVVATSKGAEGLAVQNGEHILISDEPQEFAEYVIQLFGNKELRRHISANALRLVKEQYDWSIVMPGFLTLIEKAVEDKYSLETGRK
jgi:glycosyltransferase involved in cell wall biosynthesis